MVYGPVVTYYAEAYYKSEESKRVLCQIAPQGSVGKNMHVVWVRDFYFNNQQCNANGKNTITEENEPFHLELDP